MNLQYNIRKIRCIYAAACKVLIRPACCTDRVEFFFFLLHSIKTRIRSGNSYVSDSQEERRYFRSRVEEVFFFWSVRLLDQIRLDKCYGILEEAEKSCTKLQSACILATNLLLTAFLVSGLLTMNHGPQVIISQHQSASPIFIPHLHYGSIATLLPAPSIT